MTVRVKVWVGPGQAEADRDIQDAHDNRLMYRYCTVTGNSI